MFLMDSKSREIIKEIQQTPNVRGTLTVDCLMQLTDLINYKMVPNTLAAYDWTFDYLDLILDNIETGKWVVMPEVFSMYVNNSDVSKLSLECRAAKREQYGARFSRLARGKSLDSLTLKWARNPNGPTDMLQAAVTMVNMYEMFSEYDGAPEFNPGRPSN